MATAETTHQQDPAQTTAHERAGRRRPFSTWMKKLASFKGSSSTTDSNVPLSTKRTSNQVKQGSKKQATSRYNNPYPESGRINGNAGATNGNRSPSAVPTGTSLSTSSLSRRRHSLRSSEEGQPPPTIGNKSTAATVSTDAAHSEAAQSHAPSSAEATIGTAGYGVNTGRGPDSTFSSPSPSIRSLSTTLTTIHSAAPATAAPQNNNTNAHNAHNAQSIHFSHQFPTSPPPNALPAHLAPQGSGGHPSTYNTATANNLLTDNASILTLASSSKRRRRRSMDTDASVRALAPSSLFGGSRESLPLSVLSANVESNTTSIPHQSRGPSGGGLNERASIYSTAGAAPALPSERNSYYAGKPTTTADGGSIKSGLVGHGRNDSISGSIGGIGASTSPLVASPRDTTGTSTGGKLSRNNSGWADGEDNEKVDSDTASEGKNLKESNDKKGKENGKVTKELTLDAR